MKGFVLDCSVTIAFLFEDEMSRDSEALLDHLKLVGALVPSIWPLEIGNVLTQAERRGRITNSQVHAYLDVIAKLPISIDAESQDRALREVLALAREQSLTTYDAAYLEVARRQGLKLATRDKSLFRAAERIGAGTVSIGFVSG